MSGWRTEVGSTCADRVIPKGRGTSSKPIWANDLRAVRSLAQKSRIEISPSAACTGRRAAPRLQGPEFDITPIWHSGWRSYNRPMLRSLASDTAADIERLQIEGWRRMSAAERAATVTALTRAAFEMTKVGIRHRHPGESEDSYRTRLAEILFGSELARHVFPHADR